MPLGAVCRQKSARYGLSRTIGGKFLPGAAASRRSLRGAIGAPAEIYSAFAVLAIFLAAVSSAFLDALLKVCVIKSSSAAVSSSQKRYASGTLSRLAISRAVANAGSRRPRSY